MGIRLNNVRIALKHDTLENWEQNDPVLLKGEQVAVQIPDDNIPRTKIGDGVHKFSELPYTSDYFYPLFHVINELHDRAINVVDENTVYHVDPVTGAEYLPLPDDFTDLLVRVDVPEEGSLNIRVPESIQKTYGDLFPSKGGTYLITITKISDAEMFVRSLELKEAS